jgi:hypothetical protein
MHLATAVSHNQPFLAVSAAHIAGSILLAIASFVSGVMVGGPFGSYWRGGRWLARTLSDYAALGVVWDEAFGPLGGVMAVLKGERPDRFRPRSESERLQRAVVSSQLILVEFAMFRRMRLQLGIALLLLAVFWYWLSLYYTFWVLGCFLVAVTISIAFYPKVWVKNTVCDIFRYVRMWMYNHPESLAEAAKKCHVEEVIRVLRDKEPPESFRT